MQIHVIEKDILGGFAMWIVKQSPTLPNNLTETLGAVRNYIKEFPPGAILKLPDMVMYTIDEPGNLRSYLDSACEKIPEIRVLNLRRVELDAGLTHLDIDNNEKRFRVTSNEYLPENDFVDLGALSRNIYNSLYNDFAKLLTVK